MATYESVQKAEISNLVLKKTERGSNSWEDIFTSAQLGRGGRISWEHKYSIFLKGMISSGCV